MWLLTAISHSWTDPVCGWWTWLSSKEIEFLNLNWSSFSYSLFLKRFLFLLVCCFLPLSHLTSSRWADASSPKSPRHTCLAQSQTRASPGPDAHRVEVRAGVILWPGNVRWDRESCSDKNGTTVYPWSWKHQVSFLVLGEDQTLNQTFGSKIHTWFTYE